MNHVLEVDGVQVQFNGRNILSGIYLKCETGTITGLLGRNGSGKSCLMNAIYGNLSCEKSVRINRLSVPQAFKRPGLLVYLPQFHFTPKHLSVQRILKDYGQDYDGLVDRFPGFAAGKTASAGSLSGGERKLLELYIVVKSAAQFAMLDEPFTFLSPLQVEKAMALLEEEKRNKGLLITDHLYRHIVDLSDKLYLLTNGRTIPVNTVADLEQHGYVNLSNQ